MTESKQGFVVYITTPAIPSCFVAFSAIPIPILKFPIVNSSSYNISSKFSLLYCLELWPVSYKRLVPFSRQVSNKHLVQSLSLTIPVDVINDEVKNIF